MTSAVQRGQMPRLAISFQRSMVDIHIGGGDEGAALVLLNADVDAVKSREEENSVSVTLNEGTKPS